LNFDESHLYTYLYILSFCQDRLGTNIGQVEKRFFLNLAWRFSTFVAFSQVGMQQPLLGLDKQDGSRSAGAGGGGGGSESLRP
jgi:hypothetical protein